MNEETISKDRSPRSPGQTLEDAIESVRKLYTQARSASVKPEIAAKAIGYGSLNGAALGAIATLGQYGLVSRDKGNVAVSSLALKILHPTSQQQKEDAIQEAARSPQVFTNLLKGFEECSEEVISGHLIQNSFTPERAKRVASIYADNKVFAKLNQERIIPNPPADNNENQSPPVSPAVKSITPVTQTVTNFPLPPVTQPASDQRVLAQYTIPLGENQATLVFTGQKLTAEDFDALSDFVEFSKKQFVRAAKVSSIAPQQKAAEVEDEVDMFAE